MKSDHSYTVQNLQNGFHGYTDWDVYAVRDARNHCLALVGTVDHATSPSNKDNAFLFAAAPELLEACKSAIRMWEDDPRMPNGGIADSLRSAIAKAEGTL